MNELQLYGAKTGNCLRAAVGLSEAGLTYQVRQVDLRALGKAAATGRLAGSNRTAPGRADGNDGV
jgi:GST-like protein